MASNGANYQKPHAVCIPAPAQGHITPMLQLAKILHHRGFYITFVNTEYNHRRLLKSRGPNSLDGLPDFKFETIPDGLPPSDADSTQDIIAVCDAISKNFIGPYSALLSKLQNSAPDIPPVSCLVSDTVMTFTHEAAEQFGLPNVLFWTASACGLLGFNQFRPLIEKGYIPLKDMSQVTNGYLETTLDWIPGMRQDIRLRDIPSFIRTTSADDFMLNFLANEVEEISKGTILLLNTFEELEHDSLNAVSGIYPPVYAIGPVSLLLDQIEDEKLQSISSSLWKEDTGVVDWLNTKEPNSVVYVNFGSITVMTANQLTEFAWGLANSKKPFLWIIRPDILGGDSAVLPPEFMTEIEERSMIASWCPQQQVLRHPAIGGFLTHSGWNSTLESISGGVPVICWPFFGEQQTNCRYSCVEWGIGMEIDNDVKRNEVEAQVRELMEGEKGQKMRKKAQEWKIKVEASITGPHGSSYNNLEKLFKEILPSS
ncbi:OLC1v1002665C1 [Oldenlandia corymbosa var. corymbosa]|uniref:Glycosyltransferase n=1 Tax=Oldenlandia corymbosa var. corymbosa TaxID=529605 RepID=A0AAV1DB39_OLDCO|nr:OLC1v1002665C1 [Oldenlandia corymbosa var. corymbosa]